ncbi:hypothetical protein ZOD2009_11515 [Haladaptatus paucihalophilus DX253]|uniref:Uncharacterized protein n=1 Tax=Haladaptatus paucihalophilus DX253 TaxID=797209 RepID=E7QU23_HALPU|nr:MULTISPECIES: hypothetical protein [Haladaptatus]EFW92102.1 hypothetical protein ZOD2009_11515 [Haladaptatus paucihalophilus DX253]ODR83170.1 hypothetical protein BG842_14270 [Haladaptatus sp. W1]GKZ14258.1 hypothetical protein HAL_21390 [Haladaptatus sp. T7]SHK88570.1 hypothetical protein SAMN05444342_2509 [Haladaptatus paucihalophilus DX253]
MADDLPAIDDETESALHELELGIEGLRKGHGYLVQFHHATGHAMEHFSEAETHLRDAGHDDLADHIRDEILPCGVLGGDRWTYELVESFETEFLRNIEAFERTTREEVADGERHIRERRIQRRWQERAEE